MNLYIRRNYNNYNNFPDKDFLKFIKIPSIYYRILEKFWKDTDKNENSNFFFNINCFPSYFLKKFNKQFYYNKEELRSRISTFKLEDSYFNDNYKKKKSNTISKKSKKNELFNLNLVPPKSNKLINTNIEELTIYFNSKLMKWKSEIMSQDNNLTKCRICEKDIIPADLCLHSYICSQQYYLSKIMKPTNLKLKEIIEMANFILK